MQFIFVTGEIVLVGTLLFAEWKHRPVLRSTAKSCASALFIMSAIYSGATANAYGQWVLGALVFCALGDILLLRRSSHFFLMGMGAFALGHLAYIGSFATIGFEASSSGFFAAIAAAVLSLGFLLSMWGKLGAFRLPVAAYVGIIFVMIVGAASIGALPAGVGPHALILFAAWSFAISDIAVARDQFITPSMANKIWGLPLYYAGQMAFAASV